MAVSQPLDPASRGARHRIGKRTSVLGMVICLAQIVTRHALNRTIVAAADYRQMIFPSRIKQRFGVSWYGHPHGCLRPI
jgi:hypothetical protein